jgi:hypothetical protein
MEVMQFSKKFVKLRFNLEGDTKLALSIMLLWSFGRFINPLRHFAEDAGQSVSPLLLIATQLYMLLHVVIFVYCAKLTIAEFRRKKLNLWELALYAYVFITLVVSFYFLAFELGYLPDAAAPLLPVWSA